MGPESYEYDEGRIDGGGRERDRVRDESRKNNVSRGKRIGHTSEESIAEVNDNAQPAGAGAPDAELAQRRASVQHSAHRAQRAVMTILVLACLLGAAMVIASYRALQSQRRAEKAEVEAQERSWHAFRAQARAERLSPEAGHRAKSIAAISNAAAIKASVELRDEAIASFALRDLEKEVSWPLERGAFGFYFDPELEHYIVRYAPNESSMFRLSDNALVRKFRSQDAGLPTNAVANGAIFSLTGRYVVVPYASGELVVYERSSGAAAHVFGRDKNDERLGWRPTFTTDDRILCARSLQRSNVVLFIDLETGQRREVVVPGVNESLRMNQQGDTLAWFNRQDLFFCSARDGSLLKTFPWPANVGTFRWDAQGAYVSVWCGDGSLNLLDVGTGRIRQLGGKLVGPWVQHFSPDGTMFASSGNDGTSRLWDLEEGRLIAQTTEARSFLWANDNERLAFAIPGQQVGAWRITRPQGYRVRQSSTDKISPVWFQDMSPDGKWMVISPTQVRTNPVVELISLAGDQRWIIPGKGRVSAGFHPTDPKVFIASGGELISYLLPDVQEGKTNQLGAPEKVALPGNVAPMTFSFSGNGRRAAIVDARMRLLVLDFGNSNRIDVLEGTAPVIGMAGPGSSTGSGSLAISRDGRWVAMGRNTRDTRITVWDTSTGKIAHRFAFEASHVVFSPDGASLVTIGTRTCRMVEMGTWKTLWDRGRPPLVDSVGSAAFTADGSMLAYTRAVDSIELIEPSTGNHIATVTGPTTIPLSGLRFSGDGQTLAAPSAQGRIHVWDMTALRSDLAKLGLDWPIRERPLAARVTPKTVPVVIGGIGFGAVAFAGVLGFVALRRHGRLTRQFVETAETAARLHESERAAQRALEQEKELSRLKSQFVTTVSHEFRNPLGVIMSSAENLRDYNERFTPEQRSQHLGDIFEASRTMSGLMEEVLLLGRVDAGKLRFQASPIDLRGLCDRLIDEVRSATDNRCPIQIHFIPGEGLARGDEGLLRHIIVNLLTNAVKYSPGTRPVEIRIEAREGLALITIRDHGIGIPEEDLPHLFEPFHRGRNVGDVGGTGLGMVIVKRCVELHGGSIQCESRVGKGTTFVVKLPLYDEGRISSRPFSC